jgi:THO complex subunit 4
MKIEIVVDPINLPGQSLVSRVAPAPTVATVPEIGARRGGGAPRRGRSRGGGRRKNERPAKSAADLDAEMEDYTASNGPTAPAAPAAA